MPVDEHGFQIFLGDKREPGEAMKPREHEIDDTIPHMDNFLQAVKSRNTADLTADVQVGVTSVELVHMANISYRLGRKLQFDAATGNFTGDDGGERDAESTYLPCTLYSADQRVGDPDNFRFTTKKPPIFLEAFLLLDRATSYSPTHSRVQYNRG